MLKNFKIALRNKNTKVYYNLVLFLVFFLHFELNGQFNKSDKIYSTENGVFDSSMNFALTKDRLMFANSIKRIENAIAEDSIYKLLKDQKFCDEFYYEVSSACMGINICKDLVDSLSLNSSKKLEIALLKREDFIPCLKCNNEGDEDKRSELLKHLKNRFFHDSLILNYNQLFKFKDSTLLSNMSFNVEGFYSIGDRQKKDTGINLYQFLPDGFLLSYFYNSSNGRYFQSESNSRYIIRGNQLIIEKVNVTGALIYRYYYIYRIKRNKLIFESVKDNDNKLKKVPNPESFFLYKQKRVKIFKYESLQIQQFN